MTQEEFHKRYKYNPNTDCLGEGGFGKVYKAYDTYRDRWVAIKMADVKSGFEQIRLKNEVELISKLPVHSHIAYYEECYTFSTFAGEYDFGVLQYYELGNLEQLLRAKQLTNEQKDSILRQILQGIEFLHSQGIIHRDLKPQNILVVDRNGEYIPKITDFGISKKLDVNKSSVFTNSLAGAGTLAFASPEQLLGTTIRKNTDLWSFGIIACWMFTGKLPFNTGNKTVTSEVGRIELFRQITSGVITSIISQLPTLWGNLVKQCIVVDVDKRISGGVKCMEILGIKANAINQELIPKENKNSKTIIDTKKTVRATHKDTICETVTDIDGNVYRTVRIGDQVWMAENLKVNRYRNGDMIPNIIENEKWKRMNSGAWCNYNNEQILDSKYGKLYNWFAANDIRNIAPNGWHLPTNEDWLKLIEFLGGEEFTGGKLKNNESANWKNTNNGETNKNGFSPLFGGYRYSNSTFYDLGFNSYWWSSLEAGIYFAWNIYLSSKEIKANRSHNNKVCGFSVRCIKDK